jgi:hypothetical protein
VSVGRLATSAQRAVIAFSSLSLSIFLTPPCHTLPFSMSFNDLERGEASQPLLRNGAPGAFSPQSVLVKSRVMVAERGTDEDRAFTTLKDTVSIQIFKIQSNVQGIQKLVDKLGGGLDGPALRTSLYVGFGSCLVREASQGFKAWGLGAKREEAEVMERSGSLRGPSL